MSFECISRTHVGLRRKLNEDAVLVRTAQGLWAVADGMGGHEAGEVASAMIVDALAELPTDADLDGLVRQAIATLQRVNHELIKLARSDFQPRTIGSTVVGLVIAGGHFRCFWAGDSRAYRIRAGQIRQLSRDHSLVQDLVEAGMLDAADAHNHPNANVITRAVGVVEELKVDSVSGEVRSGDLFLLASDGLTRVVDDDELLDELSARPMGEAADRLIDTVLDRGAPDNVSFVLVTVD